MTIATVPGHGRGESGHHLMRNVAAGAAVVITGTLGAAAVTDGFKFGTDPGSSPAVDPGVNSHSTASPRPETVKPSTTVAPTKATVLFGGKCGISGAVAHPDKKFTDSKGVVRLPVTLTVENGPRTKVDTHRPQDLGSYYDSESDVFVDYAESDKPGITAVTGVRLSGDRVGRTVGNKGPAAEVTVYAARTGSPEVLHAIDLQIGSTTCSAGGYLALEYADGQFAGAHIDETKFEGDISDGGASQSGEGDDIGSGDGNGSEITADDLANYRPRLLSDRT